MGSPLGLLVFLPPLTKFFQQPPQCLILIPIDTHTHCSHPPLLHGDLRGNVILKLEVQRPDCSPTVGATPLTYPYFLSVALCVLLHLGHPKLKLRWSPELDSNSLTFNRHAKLDLNSNDQEPGTHASQQH